MSKFRFGWEDLLLPAAIVPAATGHFDVLMAVLALYGLLYWRAARRSSRR